MPSEAKDLVQQFEETYVLGKVHSTMENNHIFCTAPLFSPQLWSVFDSLEIGIPRTSNTVEGWHNRCATLIGRQHVGLYTFIQEIQREQQQIEAQIEHIFHGEQHTKQKKHLAEKEKRITTIINDLNNCSLIEFLTRIAHNLSL
ncbi:1499_t:CDS:1 [Cetraspora pellucida]|uniref:1499_t:CDS:1 n=1 Tax=Cetraspora pellucida TaxID=1433469 RepID=A0A9N9JPI8_9GLOM|nr:1499_t:CDS:1 [Cetraspora pellucida]